MAIDEESALHIAPQASPIGSPSLDAKSISPLPLNGTTALPVIQPNTRASLNLKGKQQQQQQQKPPPTLLHPILHNVPLHIRFGINGFLTNLLFMVAYNYAVLKFEHMANSSTIYATVYLIFIPITHACISLLVFGWPERYMRSLMSNAPVGLTAIVLGAALTAYLDEIEFNRWVAEAVEEYWKLLGYTVVASESSPSSPAPLDVNDGSRTGGGGGSGGGEFYSSIFVLVVTGIWTFVLSVFVNAPQESSEKKEL